MPLVSTETIILQSYTYSETSKILRLLTRDHGPCSVIAKGALRPRSQYGGLLEPFSIGTATIYMKDGRELQTLSGFDLIRSGQGLGRDLIRFGTAALVTELVLRTAGGGADPALFEQLEGALLRIENAPLVIREEQGLAEAWSMLATLGFAPITDHCVGCERELEIDETTIFDHAAGGSRCEHCGGPALGLNHARHRTLPAHARLALSEFIEGQPVQVERTAAHWALLARFLTHHLSEGGMIRSLEFLAKALEAEG